MVGVRRSIQRVRDVAALLEEQRAFAAWKLGELGQHLIVASGFEYATVVLEGAKALQPSDPDYKVLLTLSALLRRNQFSTAKTLVTTHPSFEPQKRLFGLRERVERYCAERKVLEDLQPISSAPSLYTVNGVGTALYGQRDHDSRTGSYVATLFFVVLFIPLVPLGCYRVIPQGNRSWSFLGKVPFSNQERWHLRISVGLAAAFILWALASSDGGSSRPSAYVGTSTYGAPFTSSSIYSSQTPGSVAQPPSTRSTGLDSWYYAEKAQVEAMEEDLRSMDSELEGKADEIEGLKHRIQEIEQGYGEATTEDPLYTTLLHQHNGVVSDYNDLLERRKTRYQEYETDLDQVNARVDDYNARH